AAKSKLYRLFSVKCLGIDILRLGQDKVDRGLHLFQVFEMQVLFEEIAKAFNQPRIERIEIGLRDRPAHGLKVQFLIDEVLQLLDDSPIDNVECLRRDRLYLVELT